MAVSLYKPVPFKVPGTLKLLKYSASSLTTGSSNVSIISETVPSGKIWAIYQAFAICRAHTRLKVNADSIQIASLVTGAAAMNAVHGWSPAPEYSAGKSIEVLLSVKADTFSADIDVYLQVAETDG